MSRIDPTFAALKRAGRKALVPYITAGFPFKDLTPALMHTMVQAGADIIELGVPFSDPSADGPVIQRANDRALANGVGLVHVLDMVKDFRATDTTTPVVLMGYANPIERYDQKHGTDAFVRDAGDCGLDGVLVVDYPPEECHDLAQKLRARGIDLIFLLAPTSTELRMAQVAKVASGYVYYVAITGVTGAGSLDTQAVEAMLPRIRRHVGIPVGVGFGIRDARSARAVARVADAVVIGSRIIQVADAKTPEESLAAVLAFIGDIRSALDSPVHESPQETTP
jgi:tryptophan synthase alpha chain